MLPGLLYVHTELMAHRLYQGRKFLFTVGKTVGCIFTIGGGTADGNKLDAAAADSLIQGAFEIRQMLAMDGFQGNAAVRLAVFSNQITHGSKPPQSHGRF